LYDIDSTEIITGDARFASVDAVVHDRVYIVPENFVVRPNHLSVKGLMMMAQAFHPDLFGEFEAIQ